MEIREFDWDENNIEHIMRLPNFKTEEEEKKFWKNHSIADYWEDLRESDDRFIRPKLTPVTIKFDPLVLKKIKMLARKRGLSYNAYIRYLLAKSVEVEILNKTPR
jgi:predicted DNA binding CopG/RHH family protein